jgi:hypothetical protein
MRAGSLINGRLSATASNISFLLLLPVSNFTIVSGERIPPTNVKNIFLSPTISLILIGMELNLIEDVIVGIY